MVQGLVRKGHRRGRNIMVLEALACTALSGASSFLYNWEVTALVAI
jgi:hypothetical protein